MKVTITYLELKGPLKFFALSVKALRIVKQLKATNCREFKKKRCLDKTLHHDFVE